MMTAFTHDMICGTLSAILFLISVTHLCLLWRIDRRKKRMRRKVRELVDEYARLKAELKDAETEERGKAIWDRQCDIAIELAELNYVLIETTRAAYVFPIDDYYVETFGEVTP